MDCHLPYASLAAAAHAPSHPPDDPQPTDNATTLPLDSLTEGPVWLVATTETPPNTLTKPPSPPPHSLWLTYSSVDSNPPFPSLGDTHTRLSLFIFSIWFLLSSSESLYLDVMYERNLQIWDITAEREEKKNQRKRGFLMGVKLKMLPVLWEFFFLRSETCGW